MPKIVYKILRNTATPIQNIYMQKERADKLHPVVLKHHMTAKSYTVGAIIHSDLKYHLQKRYLAERVGVFSEQSHTKRC